MPDRRGLCRQIVAQRSDQVKFGATGAGGAQPGERDVLAGPAAADIVVLQRHAAKGQHERAVRDQLVPADVVARDGLLRPDDVRQYHRRGARAVAADRPDIAAGRIEKPVELAWRIVEAPGARPSIGPAEDPDWAMSRVDALQFRRDEIDRALPLDRNEPVAAAAEIGAGAALEPAAPDHRPGDPGMMRHRGGDVAEQIAQAVQQSLAPDRPTAVPGVEVLNGAMSYYAEVFDAQEGGVRRAPKFPSSMNVRFLLRYWKRTGDEEGG